MAGYILVFNTAEGAERRFELEVGTSYRIGSKDDNDVVVDQKDVSRHHAILRVDDGSFHLTDLNSKNGTYVNGVRTADSDLGCGDLVNISSVRMVVLEVSSSGYPAIPGPVSGADAEDGEPTEDTHQFHEAASPDDLVDLLELTARAVPRSALAEPLGWAVDRLGLDGAMVLFKGADQRVSMITSAGDLGELLGDGPALTRLVLDQWAAHGSGRRRVHQVAEKGDTLLVTRVGSQHVVVFRYSGSAPTVLDTRGVVAAVEAVLAVSDSAIGSPAAGEVRPLAHTAGVSGTDRIWGISRAIAALRRELPRIAEGSGPVLFVGEPGTGKTLAAEVLHRLGPAGEGPLTVVRCARGRAAEIARSDGAGSAEGRGGTTVLHGVEDCDPVSLVEAVERLRSRDGGTSHRVILTWRLRQPGEDPRVALDDLQTFFLPPLRSRREDIEVIAARVLSEVAAGDGPPSLTNAAVGALRAAPWPDNVRELIGEIRRVVASRPMATAIDLDYLATRFQEPSGAFPGGLLDLEIAESRDLFERWAIEQVLARCDGNQSRAAERLGLSRAGLFKKMRRLGMSDSD